MPDQIIFEVPTVHLNLSPALFRRHARQYLDYHLGFKHDEKNSPVPYSLLCRSVELSLKAIHLECKSRSSVRKGYGHNLLKLYEELSDNKKCLSPEEIETLAAASSIYDIPGKGFDYVSVYDAITAFKDFPPVEMLEQIARRLIAQESKDNNSATGRE